MDKKVNVKYPVVVEGLNIIFAGVSKILEAVGEEQETLLPQKGAAEKPVEAAPTLEQVRATLAEISRKGKTTEMKALLTQFGAAKLSEISEDKYADLLTAAQEIANA